MSNTSPGLGAGGPTAAQPFVSVIVPVRNEEGYIGPCLQALAQQDYPRDRFEVIVLDGESVDNTVAEIDEVAAGSGLPYFLLTNPGLTTASGLNLGLDTARGEIIVRVDGHTLVEPDFISANVAALEASGADAVGGPIQTKGRGPVGQAIALAMSSPFGVGDARFRYAFADPEEPSDVKYGEWAETVPFAAYRRDVFERIGRFTDHIRSGEDDEFNYRLRESGGRIWMSPAIGSIYYSRDTYEGLARQYWNYGLAKAKVLTVHPGDLRPRHLVPSALVLALLGSLALSPCSASARRLFLLTSGMYKGAAFVASCRIAEHGGHWRLLPYLPASFACIHLPAGAGFLVGLWRRWRSVPPVKTGGMSKS